MIASKLEARIGDLSANAAFSEKAMIGELNSRWLATLFSQNEGLVDLKNPVEVREKFFDRTDLDETVKSGYSGDGQLSEFVSAVSQIELLCALEREFSQRHSSRLRLVATQAARTIVHGGPDGVIQGGIMKMVSQFEKQGGK